MTLKTLWRRHVAWRFRAQPPVGSILDMSITSQATGMPCTRFKKPVEDVRFKYCREVPVDGDQER